MPRRSAASRLVGAGESSGGNTFLIRGVALSVKIPPGCQKERILSEAHYQSSSIRNASRASCLGSDTHSRRNSVEPRYHPDRVGPCGRGIDAAGGLFSPAHPSYLEAAPDEDSAPDSNNRSNGLASNSCCHRHTAPISNLPCFDSPLLDFRLAFLSETIKP